MHTFLPNGFCRVQQGCMPGLMNACICSHPTPPPSQLQVVQDLRTLQSTFISDRLQMLLLCWGASGHVCLCHAVYMFQCVLCTCASPRQAGRKGIAICTGGCTDCMLSICQHSRCHSRAREIKAERESEAMHARTHTVLHICMHMYTYV